MTITKRLMKTGQWNVKLVPDAPHSAFSQVAELDHIVVTACRLTGPIEGYSDANILAASIFTGVVTGKPSPYEFKGHDLSWWLGTPKGYGDLLVTAQSRTAGTLSQWIGDLLPTSLTTGTVSNTGLSTLTNTYQYVTRREAIDAVCRTVGQAEWRVNPDFTFDAADPATLFVSTPEVIVTRQAEGYEGALQGLEGTLVAVSSDVEDYITAAVVVSKGEAGAATVGTVTGSTSYYDGRNNTVVLERLIDAPTELAANVTVIGDAMVAKYNQLRRNLRLNSRTYTVSRFVEPGDYVYAWDQLGDLTDSANQVTYRGERITPLILRVHALTFPIEEGMGVYARRSTGSGYTYTDLTDFVEWETADVTWEVGADRRPLFAGPSSANANEGSVAYLGANPAVAARASARTVPGVRCRHTTGVNVTTGTNTYLAWDSDDYDTDVFHDNATNNSRITIPSNLAGTYAVGFSTLIAAGTQTFSCWIEVNRAATRFAWTQTPNDATNGVLLQGSDFLALDAGDYIEVRAFQNSGGTLAVNGNTSCSFWLYRVGD